MKAWFPHSEKWNPKPKPEEQETCETQETDTKDDHFKNDTKTNAM